MPTPSPRMGLSLPTQPDPFSTADVKANWEKIDAAPGIHICTSTTRPVWNAAQEGRKIFETNTELEYVWTGSAFKRPKGSAEPMPGTVVNFGGSTVPEGWLLCDGTTKSRATYAALFAAIDTTHGTGNGSTTFHLPNLLERYAVGAVAGSATMGVGKTGGAREYTISLANMPVHRHTTSHTHTIAPHNHTMNHSHGTVVSASESNFHAHYGFGDETGFLRIGAGNISQYGFGNTSAGTPMGEVSSTGNNIQTHTHNVAIPTYNGSTGSTGLTTSPPSDPFSGNAGSGQAMAIEPPFVALLPIIKT